MAEDYVRLANDFFANEDFEQAMEAYNKAIETDEDYLQGWLRRANCHIKMENLEQALKDAAKALEMDPNCDMAYLYRGQALFNKGDFARAKESFDKGADLAKQRGGGGLFKSWQRKCDAELKLSTTKTEEKVVETNEKKEEETVSKTIEVEEKVEEPKPVRFRHDWYQNATHVTIEIFIKKLTKEDCEITFRSDEVGVKINIQNEEPFLLDLELCDEIIPPQSEVKYFATKLVVKLRKANASNWPTLERKAGSAPTRLAPVANVNSGNKKLASFERNWDAVTKEVTKDEKDEQDALNALFKQIYKDGSDEQRQAMVKSFTESGGTCLSTNWEDVGKRKVEVSPPEHLEARTYEQ